MGGGVEDVRAAPVSASAPGAERWRGAGRDTPLADAVYPEGFEYDTGYLRWYYAGRPDDDELLMVCPRTNPAWSWRHRRLCKNCKGHPQCLVDFILSPQMLAPLGAEDAHV